MSCDQCRAELLPRLNAMKEKAFEAGKKNERARIARMLSKMPADKVLYELKKKLYD